MQKFYYLFMLAIGSVACHYAVQTDAIQPSLQPTSFYFTEKGQFCMYAVESKQYALGKSVESQIYWLRVQVKWIQDSLTYQKMGIEVSSRSNMQQAWVFEESIQAIVSEKELIEIRQNVPMLLLHTPLYATNQWNFNAYNLQNRRVSKIAWRKFDFTWQDKVFKEALWVEAYKDSTAVAKRSSELLYLAGVGLAYREDTDVQYCYQGNCVGKSQIDFGKEIRYKLIEYGKE